jgi:hypothetical protein
MAQQPTTPGGGAPLTNSIFGVPSLPTVAPPPVPGSNNVGSLVHASTGNASLSAAPTPGSAASSSSANTYIMPNSPVKNRPLEGYRPKVTRTLGQRPACLVNASVTYCGNNQIYAFGGFDQYTDEVYNHVLRLDLVSHQWSLVDNYGDIPGVRMGKISLDSLSQSRRLMEIQATPLQSTRATSCLSLAARTSIERICLT